MADFNRILVEIQKLDEKIKSVLILSSYEEYDDWSELQIDDQNSQQLFLLDKLGRILENLSDVHDRIPYLFRFIGNSDFLKRKKKHMFTERMLDNHAFWGSPNRRCRF